MDGNRPSRYIKKGWCQRAPARGLHGRPIDPEKFGAKRWSLLGAIDAAIMVDGYGRDNKRVIVQAVHHILSDIFDDNGYERITQWEDDLRYSYEDCQSIVYAVLMAAEEIAVHTWRVATGRIDDEPGESSICT